MNRKPMTIEASYRSPTVGAACAGGLARLRYACECTTPADASTHLSLYARDGAPIKRVTLYLAHTVAPAYVAGKYADAYASVEFGYGDTCVSYVHHVFYVRPVALNLAHYHRDEDCLVVSGYKAARTRWRFVVRVYGDQEVTHLSVVHKEHGSRDETPDLSLQLLKRADFQTVERLFDPATPLDTVEALLEPLFKGPRDRLRKPALAWFDAVISARATALGDRLG